MKLLFSEQNSDYENYQFPYAIWGVPEEGESPSDIFDAGFCRRHATSTDSIFAGRCG